MRVTRLKLHNFRGWADLDLRPSGHVVLAGVPRGGRSDIIAGLARLLDPSAIRTQPALADIRQRRLSSSDKPNDEAASPASAEPGASAGAPSAPTSEPPNDATERPELAGHTKGVAYSEYAEAEATLADLDEELAQLCDGFLEPLDADGQIDESDKVSPDAPLGVRLAYRVTYDPKAGTTEQVTYFPWKSKPPIGQYMRVPAAVRRALPVVALNTARPLQLRAEGAFRRLVTDRDADGATTAFRALEQGVATATFALSTDETIAATIGALFGTAGIGRRLGDRPVDATAVQFRPDDGSLPGLLRAIQPTLDLDDAGLLALANHGSTTAVVLATAEALLLCASVPGALVIGDDFGDGLDAATAEHLASVLRARTGQVWLTTRRPEVARAFAPSELVRLTRHAGTRAHHVLGEPTDRKEAATRRVLQTQLLPALTAPVVAVVEGPHDLTTYSSADRHRALSAAPLSAHGVRLVSADSGFGGGTSQIPRVANLAHSLGFRVVGVIDGDPAKTSAGVIPDVEAACDAVVRLPTGFAVERALVDGVPVDALRAAAAVLPAYGVPDPTIGVADPGVADACASLLHKGLHEQFMDALVDKLGYLPPIVAQILDAVSTAADPAYAGPPLIELQAPAASAPPAGTP